MQIISVNQVYASGARRWLAWLIDSLLLSTIVAMLFHHEFEWGFWEGADWWNWHHWWSTVLSFGFLRSVVRYLYYGIFESSKYQATIGKMALGLRVVDGNGQRLDFSRAMLRNLSKIISWLLLGIGYLMILFDEKHQGLHDKIADSYVVRT